MEEYNLSNARKQKAFPVFLALDKLGNNLEKAN